MMCDYLGLGDELSRRCEYVFDKEECCDKHTILYFKDGSCAIVDRNYTVVHLARSSDKCQQYFDAGKD